MNGLVAYDYDSPSDSEAGPSGSKTATTTGGTHDIGGEKHNENANDKSLKSSGKASSSEGRRIQKTQVIIKRPTIIHKSQLRTHTADELVSDEQQQQEEKAGASREASSSMDLDPPQAQAGPPSEFLDPLSRLRKMLKPPSIPGVENWGIPPETTEKCEAGLQTKFAKFSSLKLDRSKPMHFNDSLMSNRSFRNPHLYTHLVDWVDVDERTTNFPKDLWDPDDVKPDWYANQIADAQKERSEKQAASQTSGKRSHIEFSSGSSRDKSSASNQRDEGHGHAGGLGAPPRKSRFAPYSVSSSSASGGGAKERQKTRWG